MRITWRICTRIYARDERRAMNLVSWIETFNLFLKVVLIIQKKPMK